MLCAVNYIMINDGQSAVKREWKISVKFQNCKVLWKLHLGLS